MPSAIAALAIGSSVLAAGGALVEAKSQSDAAKYTASVNDLQAKQAGDQAAYAAGLETKKTRQQLAAQRAGATQTGVDTTGSVLDAMKVTAGEGGLNYLTQIYNGDVSAVSSQNDAALNRRKANAAMTAGYFKATSSILGGVSSGYKRAGNNISVGGT